MEEDVKRQLSRDRHGVASGVDPPHHLDLALGRVPGRSQATEFQRRVGGVGSPESIVPFRKILSSLGDS